MKHAASKPRVFLRPSASVGSRSDAAISSGKRGNREATSKRSMPTGQGSATSAVAAKTRKRYAEEDCTTATAGKDGIAAIMSDPGDFNANWAGVTGAGHGSQTVTGTLVASASSASNAAVKCDEGGRSSGIVSQRSTVVEQRPVKVILHHSGVRSPSRISLWSRAAQMQGDFILARMLRRARSFPSRSSLGAFHGRGCQFVWRV